MHRGLCPTGYTCIRPCSVREAMTFCASTAASPACSAGAATTSSSAAPIAIGSTSSTAGRETICSAGLPASISCTKTLQGLQGRRVELRGWIEYRSGPYIAIEDPSQLTVIDEDAYPQAVSPGGPVLSSEHDNAEPSKPHKRKR